MLIQNDEAYSSTKEYSNQCKEVLPDKKIIKTDLLTITKTKDIDYIQFNKLLEHNNLTHAMILKNHDVGFKRTRNLYNNIRESSYLKLEKEFQIDLNNIIQPYQEHTDNIYEFKDINLLGPNLYNTKLDSTDGILCNVKNVGVLTTSADCTPILMYDPIKNVYANIHSGWKSTVKKIAQKSVIKLIKDYDCNPRNLICCIGPCIRKECFLVNEDVVKIYGTEFQEYVENYNVIEETDLFNEKGQQYRVDNSLIIKLMLEDINVPEENIIDCNICTVCNSYELHSRRSEGEKFQTNGCLMFLN